MNDIIYLDVDSVVPNTYNPNTMPLDVFESLLNDAKLHGAEALDPISVRPLDFLEGRQRYEIIDGENRWKVAKQLGWKRIRAFILKASLDEAKTINYRKNRERGTLDPFKEAKLFKQEYDNGLTHEQIAEKYSVNRTYVTERLPIATEITQETKSIVEHSTMLTPSHLIELTKLKDPEKQKLIAEKIVSKGLSVHETEVTVKLILQPTPEKPETTTVSDQMEKMCSLERDLFQLIHILERYRTETLKCEDCPQTLREWCNRAKPKILTIGTELSEIEV
jgi:ParB family chromosome partitioning protein